MPTIRVPKTPKSAFNKNRRASKLLLSQIDHLEWAIRPASRRKPHQLPKNRVKTEGQAAARIAELTRQLREAAGVPYAPPPPPPLSPPRAPRKTVRRARKK